MAIGVVHLTRRQRYTLAIAFISLNIIQSILGLVIIIWSIYICVAVSPILYSERSEVKFVFTIIGLYGLHILFQNLIGIKICQKCYLQAHKKSTKRLLFLWTLAGYNTLINVLIVATMAVKISKHIVRTMRHSLEKGIKTYLKDRYWKYSIDTLQVKYKCCGVKSYLDWYETAWVDHYHVNIEDDLVKELRMSVSSLQLPITPWSCCKTDFPMQCFHDPLQQVDSVKMWKDQPSTILDSINSNGCLALLRNPIETALAAFIIITALIVLLQITTVLISRLVYTSCRNAVILNDTAGVAPGWIFGRGDCGWSRGPTLMNIVMGEPRSRGNSASSRLGQKSNRSSGRVSFQLQKPTKMARLLAKFKKNKKTATSDEDRSGEDPISSDDEKALMLN